MAVAIQMAMIRTIVLERENGNSGRLMGQRNFKYFINVYDMKAEKTNHRVHRWHRGWGVEGVGVA